MLHRRRFGVTLLWWLAVCTAVALVPVGAQEAGGATIEQVGWWNRLNDAPLETGVASPPAPPTNVRAGDIAVGAVGGDPDKVAAVGITIDAAPGSTVASMTLTLKEHAGTSANAAGATIVACPAGEFWAAGENAAWATRPPGDCEAAEAVGKRAEDGTWTFDLTSIGAQWVDGTLQPNGVVLQEKVDNPVAFQVTFVGRNEGAPVVELQASGGGGEDDEFAGGDTGAVTDGGGDVSSGETPSFDTGAPIDVGAAPIADPGAPPAVAPGGDAPAAGGGGGQTEEAGAPREPDHTVLGNLPLGTLLLLPILAGVALLGAYLLGPAGEPLAVIRERGVSRALAARERATAHPHPDTAMEASTP